MDDDKAWIDTAREAPAVPADAAVPTPDDLAYVVMRREERTGGRYLVFFHQFLLISDQLVISSDFFLAPLLGDYFCFKSI